MKANQHQLSTSLSRGSRVLRRFSLLSLAALAMNAPAVGQTYHVQARDSQYGGEESTSDWPQKVVWVGLNPKTYMVGVASAGPGILGGDGISECYAVTGTYQSTICNADFEFDDVIFTSTGTASTEWVTLNLMIEGDYVSINPGASVEVKVKLQSSWVGAAKADVSGITATGGLIGYKMNTPLSFQVPLHVVVNTPFKVKVGLFVGGTSVLVGDKAKGEYRLRLGGAPLKAGGASYSPFTLPPGVTTVNSVKGGIVNNVWEQPKDLYLMPSQATVSSGDTLTLASWNGTPLQPVGLFLTSVDAAPLAFFLGGSLLDATGAWGFGPLPHAPALAGHSFGFTSLSIDALGALVLSQEETVMVL